jgi:hypothetical protein
MTSNMRNLIIGAIVVVVIGVGVAVAAGGGDDGNNVGEVATTPIDGEEEATDGSGDGSSSGGSSSGGSSSGGSTDDGSGSSQGGNQDGDEGGGDDGGGGGDEAPPPETTSAPAVNLISQNCNSGKLIAGVTANASNAYRKGVKSVRMERQNDEDAYLPFNAQWLGPETGAGDVWNATLNYGNNFGKTLRVIATSDSNQTTTKEYPITVNC